MQGLLYTVDVYEAFQAEIKSVLSRTNRSEKILNFDLQYPGLCQPVWSKTGKASEYQGSKTIATTSIANLAQSLS